MTSADVSNLAELREQKQSLPNLADFQKTGQSALSFDASTTCT